MIELLTNHPILATSLAIAGAAAIYWRLVYYFHRWLDTKHPPVTQFPHRPLEQ